MISSDTLAQHLRIERAAAQAAQREDPEHTDWHNGREMAILSIQQWLRGMEDAAPADPAQVHLSGMIDKMMDATLGGADYPVTFYFPPVPPEPGLHSFQRGRIEGLVAEFPKRVSVALHVRLFRNYYVGLEVRLDRDHLIGSKVWWDLGPVEAGFLE